MYNPAMTLFSAQSAKIDPLSLLLVGGPDDGDTPVARVIEVFDGKRGVFGRHGQGFYWLPVECHRDHTTGYLYAVWEPHPDARSSWTRDV